MCRFFLCGNCWEKCGNTWAESTWLKNENMRLICSMAAFILKWTKCKNNLRKQTNICKFVTNEDPCVRVCVCACVCVCVWILYNYIYIIHIHISYVYYVYYIYYVLLCNFVDTRSNLNNYINWGCCMLCPRKFFSAHLVEDREGAKRLMHVVLQNPRARQEIWSPGSTLKSFWTCVKSPKPSLEGGTQTNPTGVDSIMLSYSDILCPLFACLPNVSHIYIYMACCVQQLFASFWISFFLSLSLISTTRFSRFFPWFFLEKCHENLRTVKITVGRSSFWSEPETKKRDVAPRHWWPVSQSNFLGPWRDHLSSFQWVSGGAKPKKKQPKMGWDLIGLVM